MTMAVFWFMPKPRTSQRDISWCKVLYFRDRYREAPDDIWNSGSANPYKSKEII